MTDSPDSPTPPERRPRIDADLGREPELLAGRLGTRMVSHAALVERIAAAFIDEHGQDAARESRTERLKRLHATTDYILAIESVALTASDRAKLLRDAYSDLFGYGPLDPLLADEHITTIALEGPDRVAVRYDHGELTPLGPIFDDEAHQRDIVGRMLAAAGAELRDDIPIIETGLTVDDRPLALSVAMPPATLTLNADIRLHLAQPPSLESLVEIGVLIPDAEHFLAALVASPYGVIVVGDTESGKTTLLGALARRLPDSVAISAVERAGELRLPDHAQRHTVRWPVGDAPGVTFADQIDAALQASPDVLLLDEIRADDAAAVGPLLIGDAVPRQMWAFRGAPDAKRLQAALGMLARRVGAGEALVHTLYERLPFVVSMARIQGRLQLFSIGEWQPTEESDYPDYVLLFQYRDGAARPTDRQPRRPVALG